MSPVIGDLDDDVYTTIDMSKGKYQLVFLIPEMLFGETCLKV